MNKNFEEKKKGKYVLIRDGDEEEDSSISLFLASVLESDGSRQGFFYSLTLLFLSFVLLKAAFSFDLSPSILLMLAGFLLDLCSRLRGSFSRVSKSVILLVSCDLMKKRRLKTYVNSGKPTLYRKGATATVPPLKTKNKFN
ncbi:hypothetical protein Bca4012_084961 [Brassica carinata]